MRFAQIPLAALALFLLPSAPAGAQLTSDRVATGLSFPVFATHAPGDSSRLFVVEQAGRIRLLKDDVLQGPSFLDITGIVNGGGEQGLLGLAFHPDYATNGFFYVYFIEGSGNGNSVLYRYSVSGDPDLANAASGQRIFQLPQPFSNHNGGHIAFGPDGYLYFGLGDGGSGSDPLDRAQDRANLFGSLLRLDVDGDDFPGDPNADYAIPPTNPYAGHPTFREEIWAYGLRNPYRWSFDRLTGDLWIGDVGQDCFEEISWTPGTSTGGENYGWDVMEGPNCFNESPFNCNQGTCGTGLVDPVYWIAHGVAPESIIGGYVYRGSSIPAIQGEYFFAEFYSATVQSLGRGVGATLADTTDWTAALDTPTTQLNQVSGFGENLAGELYVLDADGDVFKIVPDPTAVPIVNPPASFRLEPATPNPFRETTRVDVHLETAAELRASVYDAAGRRIRTLREGPVPAGRTPLVWDGRGERDAPSPAGVYFLRVRSEGHSETARVVLIR